MLFTFLKKQKEFYKQKIIVKDIINNLNVSQAQKDIYLNSLDILDEAWLKKLYDSLTIFVEKLEQRTIADYQRQNYSKISWLRKKEIEEKQQEINSFSLLLNNI